MLLICKYCLKQSTILDNTKLLIDSLRSQAEYLKRTTVSSSTLLAFISSCNSMRIRLVSHRSGMLLEDIATERFIPSLLDQETRIN